MVMLAGQLENDFALRWARLPQLHETFLPIKVTWVIECGHFWAQRVDSLEEFEQMQHEIDSLQPCELQVVFYSYYIYFYS